MQFSLWCPEFPRKEGEDILDGYIMYAFTTTSKFLLFLFVLKCQQTLEIRNESEIRVEKLLEDEGKQHDKTRS
jgi:hypothetical protein